VVGKLILVDLFENEIITNVELNPASQTKAESM
jgi:hypothetical protein